MDTNNPAASAGFLAGIFLVYVIVICALIVFTIWVYWRIFAKAGYNGALSLLNFTPGSRSADLRDTILAFGRWPIEDQLAALQGGGDALPGLVPPTAPPGTFGHDDVEVRSSKVPRSSVRRRPAFERPGSRKGSPECRS